MDPHSRLSQFNQRPPKSGPQLQYIRQMEPKTTAVFEQFRKSSSASSLFSPSSSGSTKGSKEPPARPIASNSRVRRDEKYRRDMYLAFIDNALTQKAQGVSEHYDDLVRQFNPIAGQTQQLPVMAHAQQLRAYLTALAHVVSKLDRTHSTLVDAIVGMPWMAMEAAFVKTYISFIGMLVSARPEYLTLVLEQVAQNLTYHSARKALDAGFAESSAAPLTRRVVYDRVHNLLARLLALIPTLPTPLFPLLAYNFPHKRQNQAEHVTYIRNLLQLSDYCPELWDRILGLIVDRTIQIDVEIQVELEELEVDGTSDDGEEIFHLDVFDTVIGQEGDGSDSESDDEDNGDGLSDISSDAGSDDSDQKAIEEEQTNVKHVRDMVSKLDSILEVIFKHLGQLHAAIAASPSDSPKSPPAPTEPSVADTSLQTFNPLTQSNSERQALAESHFHALLSIFEHTILRTFKSRYTQFLVFWYSSLDTQFRDRFLGTVVSTALLEPEQPVVTRAAAASYVASYVSRAAFVARGEAQLVVRVLCQFLEIHLNEFDAFAQECAIGRAEQSQSQKQNYQSAEQHAVFYAAAQAVFLIFCFRWRDLMQQDENEGDMDEFGGTIVGNGGAAIRAWMPQLNVMQRVVNSPLNPLKVCSSNVVQQFARVAQRVGFIYCFSILEANKRSDYSPDAKSRRGANTLTATMSQSLPRSCKYIDGIYRDWTSVAIDDSEEEDEDENDENEDEDEENEEARSDGLPTRSSLSGDLYMHGPVSFVDGPGSDLGESFGGMSISPAQPWKVATT
ncbi:hypothetical protein EW145_g323 [Phellinidium pouzarii]|uniref:RNA polymerase I-specific transcription initiation factor RRN3 n=1 Tax=Phellinidium pouzarii TaxID=167371 RepID=A0A4V3XE16_9AGAM|nr:hypothetical protein EW145_g323 [Phellinidium pouzarii]